MTAERGPESEVSPLARTKGHFPESDNPVDAEHRYRFYQRHMKNACGTCARWLTDRAKGLAAGFGVFLSVCVMVLLPPSFTQNPVCHLWAINRIWGGETFGPVHLESHLVLPDLGAALHLFLLFFFFAYCCLVTLRFLLRTSKKKRGRGGFLSSARW